MTIYRQNAPSSTASGSLQVTPLTGGAWADLVLLPAEAKFSMEAYSGLLQCCCFLKGVGNPSKERVVTDSSFEWGPFWGWKI